MEDVYDLRQHSHCVIIHISENNLHIELRDTSNRKSLKTINELDEKASITYNKDKTDILSWGDISFEAEDGEDDVRINGFMEGLYIVFKKAKDIWDEEDKFMVKAVSDFLSLAIDELMEDEDMENESLASLHYAFSVPSEWEEEIREDLIRPIFIQANLISSDDHIDRLIFISEIESICYMWKRLIKREQNTIICRRTPLDPNTALIKLDLIKTTNTLFDFPNSMLFPKIIRSSSFSISIDDIKNSIKTFLIENMFPDNLNIDQLNIIDTIKEEIYNKKLDDDYDDEFYENDEDDGEDKLINPIFIDTTNWDLNDSQTIFLKAISPLDICVVIGKTLIENTKDLLASLFVKKYELLVVTDLYSSEVMIDASLVKWLKYMFEYNKRVLNELTTLNRLVSNYSVVKQTNITFEMKNVVLETIHNSDMNCPPRIISVENELSSSSIFLNAAPDVIVNIDISFNSTLLSCSILNNDGLIEEILDHSSFVPDKCLPALNSFYDLSKLLSLTVKEHFFQFVEEYVSSKSKNFVVNERVLSQIEAVLFNKDFTNEERISAKKKRTRIKAFLMNLICIKEIKSSKLFKRQKLISARQNKYIRTFLLIYLIYVKEIISKRLLKHVKLEKPGIKIGYAISMEKMLLDNIFGSKDVLREIVYSSGLINKDDSNKKLRIITQGEGVLSMIQQLFNLEFPVKSYFVLAQIHENYIQLTLNQVVTASNSRNEQQEAVIIEDKIIKIQNIYQSLCLSMWNNIIQNSSLINLCDIHNAKNHEDNMLDLFSLKTRTEFIKNLEDYISNNIFSIDSKFNLFEKTSIKLNCSCNCKLCLTISDVIDISFKPFLEDITSVMLAALINDDMFGKYSYVSYHFCSINFNFNRRFLDILTNILDEESDNFKPTRGIETLCMVIPELPSQFFQSTLKILPFLYKGFRTGTLYQVYNDDYGFLTYFLDDEYGTGILYIKKRTNAKSITVNKDNAFLLLKKGDLVSNTDINKKIYLNTLDDGQKEICIDLFKYKSFDLLKKDGMILGGEDTRKIIHESSFKLDFTAYDDLSLIINIKSLGHSSSTLFAIKLVGENAEDYDMTEMGEPMTLGRF